MNIPRKLIVNTLATIAFVFLFLLPVLGFVTTTTEAGETSQSAVTHSNDYVFFIVQDNSEVPLAATPSSDISTFILWTGLASFAIVIIFMYFAWYLSVRRNLRELSDRLSPLERRAYMIPQGYLHPVRSYRLAREAEDTVASIYTRYI